MCQFQFLTKKTFALSEYQTKGNCNVKHFGSSHTPLLFKLNVQHFITTCLQVPYLMGRQFNSKFKATFEKAKKMFFALTGIIFVKKGTFDCDYVKLTDDKKLGCSSNIGKIGGEQIMNLCKISWP